MPAKNSVKQYLENGFYHLYNRGVEKRLIFQDKQDYSVFLSYLNEYLLPKDEKGLRQQLNDPNLSFRNKDKILKKLALNNFAHEITLIAYCLMPNHFHFLIKQKSTHAIDAFMQSLSTRYTMYFNRKYKRVGSLYQAVYKASSINTDEYLLELSRYIHKQAIKLGSQPCSYLDYIGARKTEWVKPGEILSFFSRTNPYLSYESFVSQSEYLTLPQDIILED
jgi:putative transposase